MKDYGIHHRISWGHTRALAKLWVGDAILVQNQTGKHPLCWDNRGTIVKCKGYD
jgi:hypothetical protein